MEIFQKILEKLAQNKVKYILSEHEPVRTSLEAAKIRGVDLKTGAKAMIVKAKAEYYEAVAKQLLQPFQKV
ncbi:MAG: hypothetical protein HY376_00150 [Candidatus Blackburnbacteria bacterium]|nr:hypothetical protein [Candidatus Blackburnbacteria bacterium]